MLRVSLCVVVVHVALGLGVDDTEKRRSEEILRAVAAAATADYEGLQQMKFQKATTGGKIQGTTDTHNCVAALEAALRAEKEELENSVSTENSVLTTDGANVTAETTQLKEAISLAIHQVYDELNDKYNDVSQHAAEMEHALKAELNARTTDITAHYEPATLFNEIMTNAVQQLKADEFEDDPAVIGGALKEMMLESARENAYLRTDGPLSRTPAEKRAEETKYIQVENMLLYAGSHNANNYDGFNNGRPSGNPAQEGALYTPNGAPQGALYPRYSNYSRNASDSVDADPREDPTTLVPGGFTELERANFAEVEQRFIDWTVAKSHFHNTSTKKTALDAAVAMVQAKIDAVSTASGSVTTYREELQGLEDDEMRKIHDIKEEFESLAADWLQLATYHCCDIVQGNAIECDDATAHLIAPINTVFPNALRKPNVQTDCTRRLL